MDELYLLLKHYQNHCFPNDSYNQYTWDLLLLKRTFLAGMIEEIKEKRVPGRKRHTNLTNMLGGTKEQKKKKPRRFVEALIDPD